MTFYRFHGRIPVAFGGRYHGWRTWWTRIVGVQIGPWFIGAVRGVPLPPTEDR